MDFLSTLSTQDAFLVTAGGGLACHLVFKRFEPTEPLVHLGLLVAAPTLLSSLFIPHFSNTVTAVIIAFSTYVSALVISVVSYRLSPYHPLARYPGPVMGKISKLWMSWMCTKGKQHIYYRMLHEKYGDVVRIGPNELSFRDAAAVNPSMGSQGLPKGPMWTGRIPEAKSKPLIALSGPEHTLRRRPWNRAFNSVALKDYEEIVNRRASQLMQALGNQVGPTNLSQWISYFTFDFMSDMAFGGGSEMLREGDKDGIWHALDSATMLSTLMGHSPWLGPYYMLLPNVGKDKKKFRAFCMNRGALRIAQGSSTKDAFHHFLNEGGVEANPPTIAEVISDSGLIIVAGSDTTATVLSSLFWFIMCNPSVYRRLQDEIDRYFPLGEDAMDTSKHIHMSYLNAVINETLRLLPPVLSGSQRTVTKGTGGATVGPHAIPEGTSVFVHIYSLHRDPRYFSPMPDIFWPERWLTAEERASTDKVPVNVVLDKSAFIPFSFGPSICVGKNLAYQEMRMVVCLLLQTFDLKMAEGYDPQQWERNIEDRFVAHIGCLPVCLSPRVA